MLNPKDTTIDDTWWLGFGDARRGCSRTWWASLGRNYRDAIAISLWLSGYDAATMKSREPEDESS